MGLGNHLVGFAHKPTSVLYTCVYSTFPVRETIKVIRLGRKNLFEFHFRSLSVSLARHTVFHTVVSLVRSRLFHTVEVAPLLTYIK